MSEHENEQRPLSPISRRAFLRTCSVTVAGAGAAIAAAVAASPGCGPAETCYCDFAGQDYDVECGVYCDYANYGDF